MGTNTLPQRSDGVPMPASWFNDIRTALNLNVVPRNANGIPTDEAGSLGNSDYQWLEVRAKRFFLDGSLIDVGTVAGKPHRITAGKQNSTTQYPEFLTPAGAGSGLSCLLVGTSDEFEAIINNVTTSISADTTFSSLTAAPGSNNTCKINDSGLTGAQSTKILGEYDSKEIIIDTIGSEISDRDGEIAAFSVNSEIFLALIDTSNNKLWPIYRGWAQTDRGFLSNNDTMTLLQINVLLLKNDGSTKVNSTYWPESVTTAPTAGTAGKIYVERETNKIGYDTGTAIDYDYMIVGYAVCDDTDCTNAQIYDMELSWQSDVDVELKIASTTQVDIKRGSFASVNGETINFTEDYSIDQSTDMDSGQSITASTLFYVYLKQDGSAVFSLIQPRKWDSIKKGFYHPQKYFRCIGGIFTSTLSNWLYKREERKSVERIRDEFVIPGTIVPWTGGYYGNGYNGSFTNVMGNSTVAVKLILPDTWKLCDGSEIYDPESPIFNGSGRYIENLTDDRFLMGDTAAGNTDGSNTKSITGVISGTQSIAHTHNFAHHHQWLDADYIASRRFNFYTLTTGSNSTGIANTAANQYFESPLFSGGTTYPGYTPPLAKSADFNGYTAGVLSAPSGSGTSANTGAMSANATVSGSNFNWTSTTSTENRPSYLSCYYIRKIK